MTGTLPVACGLAQHTPSPSKADSRTIESRGTFSLGGLHWAWFFILLFSAKSIHTTCARVYEFKNRQRMWGTWNNLSNNDFDRGSPSLKDVKVSWQKWNTKHILTLTKEVASKGELSLEGHTEQKSQTTLSTGSEVQESPSHFPLCYGSKLAMTHQAYWLFSGWQVDALKCEFKSAVKSSRHIFHWSQK